jgi:hypothetical protein
MLDVFVFVLSFIIISIITNNTSDKLAAETETNRRIGQAATTYFRLTKGALKNTKLTYYTKA